MTELPRFRLRRRFGYGVDPARPYVVETEGTFTAAEAMELLRTLGSPYNGQLYDNRPTPRSIEKNLEEPS